MDRQVHHGRVGLILFGVLIVVLLGLMALNPLGLNVDSAMYLEVGRYLLDGRVPYVDYIELNPPLIHYINVVPVWLGQVLTINPIIMYKALVFLLMLYAAGMAYVLLRSSSMTNRVPYQAVVPAMIVLATLMDYPDYGQRDHLIALVLVPWLILRTMRYHGDPVGNGQALLVGSLAAVGMALRPYFVVALAVVELYYLLRYRQLRHVFNMETITVILLGVAYLAHFWVLPEAARRGFFDFLVPYVSENYDSYALFSGELLWVLLIARYIHWLFIIPAAFGLLWLLPDVDRSPLFMPLFLFVVMAFAVYLAQQLGFTYHMMPFTTVAMILLGMLLQTFVVALGRDEAAFTVSLRVVRLLLVGFVALSTITILVLSVGTRVLNTLPDYEAEVAIIEGQTVADETVFFVDSGIVPAFPTLIQLDRHLDMTYPVGFPLSFATYDYPSPAALYGEASLPDDLEDYLAIVGDDIRRYQPALIFIKRGSCYGCPEDFDIHRMLDTQGVLDDWLTDNYQALDESTDDFMVYIRMDT